MTPTVDILIQQAQLADREGRRDDARALYERALFSLERRADAPTASSLLRWIGRLHRQAGDVDAALEAFDAALTIAELADDDAEIGKAYHEQADAYRRLGHLDRAEALYLRGAVARPRHSGDAPQPRWRPRASASSRWCAATTTRRCAITARASPSTAR